MRWHIHSKYSVISTPWLSSLCSILAIIEGYKVRRPVSWITGNFGRLQLMVIFSTGHFLKV